MNIITNKTYDYRNKIFDLHFELYMQPCPLLSLEIRHCLKKLNSNFNHVVRMLEILGCAPLNPGEQGMDGWQEAARVKICFDSSF